MRKIRQMLGCVAWFAIALYTVLNPDRNYQMPFVISSVTLCAMMLILFLMKD